MTRDRPPDRRASLTTKVQVEMDGQTREVLVTIGFRDVHMTQPIEVFCADWKAGTSIHHIVIDACILLSRLMQHGDHPDDLARSLCDPPSVVGSIARSIVAIKNGAADV